MILEKIDSLIDTERGASIISSWMFLGLIVASLSLRIAVPFVTGAVFFIWLAPIIVVSFVKIAMPKIGR